MTKWVIEIEPTVSEMVEEFIDTMGQEPSPTLYSELISEEFEEWLDEPPFSEGDIKELADIVYVIYGYAIACGFDLDEAVRRVHKNNMDRCIQPDGTIKRREDGKILKNLDHPKVSLADLVPEWWSEQLPEEVKE